MLTQIVHFHETNAGGVVHATHDRGVVARWQLCDDRRLGWSGRSATAISNISYLVASDGRRRLSYAASHR